MPSRPVEAIFQVTRVTIVTSGTPTSAVQVHHVTRDGRSSEMIAVTVGDLLVYCYDAASVHTFASVWATAIQVAPPGLPEVIHEATADRHDVGVVLRVDGAPRAVVQGLGAAANPTGRPHVSVTIGPLLVLAFDRTSVATWSTTWQAASDVAARMWPAGSRHHDAEVRRQRRDSLRRSVAGALDPVGAFADE